MEIIDFFFTLQFRVIYIYYDAVGLQFMVLQFYRWRSTSLLHIYIFRRKETSIVSS